MTTRSGSRAPTNPRTTAQRQTRFRELTARAQARRAEASALQEEANRMVVALHEIDGQSFRAIGELVDQTAQNAHLLYRRAKTAQAEV